MISVYKIKLGQGWFVLNILNIPNMRKGIVTHSSIDNNDGREDTMTRFGTTHDTNSTLFQLPTVKERTTIPTILEESDSIDFSLQETDNFALQYW